MCFKFVSRVAGLIGITLILNDYKVLALEASAVNLTYHTHSNIASLEHVKRDLRGCYLKFKCFHVWKDAVKTCQIKTKFHTSTFNASDPENDKGFHMCLFVEAQEKINDPSTTCEGFPKENQKFDLLADYDHSRCVSNITNKTIPLKRAYVDRSVSNAGGYPKNIENLFFPLSSPTVQNLTDTNWEDCARSAHVKALHASEKGMHTVFRYSTENTEYHCTALRDWYGAYFAKCVRDLLPLRPNMPMASHNYRERLCLGKTADGDIKDRRTVFEELYAQRKN